MVLHTYFSPHCKHRLPLFNSIRNPVSRRAFNRAYIGREVRLDRAGFTTWTRRSLKMRSQPRRYHKRLVCISFIVLNKRFRLAGASCLKWDLSYVSDQVVHQWATPPPSHPALFCSRFAFTFGYVRLSMGCPRRGERSTPGPDVHLADMG